MDAIRAIKSFHFRHAHSPLKIRSSVRRLRKCSRRGELVRYLLWPLPWRFAPSLPPINMANIGSNETIIDELQPGIRQLYCIPLYRWRDTPLCSLYRMAEDLCARDFVMMGYECEYMFYHHEPRWHLSNISDPKESDPVFYAILASLVEALVEAFNWKLGLGIRRNHKNDLSDERHTNFKPEQAPARVAAVKSLDETLDLSLDSDGCREGKPNAMFLKRKIHAPCGDLYNV